MTKTMWLDDDECKSCVQLLEGHKQRQVTRPEAEGLTFFLIQPFKGD
jgi:hypothetical protein